MMPKTGDWPPGHQKPASARIARTRVQITGVQTINTHEICGQCSCKWDVPVHCSKKINTRIEQTFTLKITLRRGATLGTSQCPCLFSFSSSSVDHSDTAQSFGIEQR